MREAANASQLKRNFAGSDAAVRARGALGLLPRRRHGDGAHPRRADQRHGAPARRRHRHRAAGRERRARSSSRRCSGTTSSTPTCIPGNIFVLIDDPRQPRYAAVDFGIVGTLDPRDQHYLAENFLAVFDRDYRRVAHAARGVRLGARRTRASTRWSRAVRTVCEPIFDKPLKDISFGTHPAAAVRDLAALQHGDPAAAASCCRRRCSTSKGWGATCTRTSTSGTPRARSCASGCASASACAPACSRACARRRRSSSRRRARCRRLHASVRAARAARHAAGCRSTRPRSRRCRRSCAQRTGAAMRSRSARRMLLGGLVLARRAAAAPVWLGWALLAAGGAQARLRRWRR